MKKRGISVLILAITIVIMTILVSTTIVGINLATNDARLRVLINDLNQMEEKIKETYILTGMVPTEGTVMTYDQVLLKVEPEYRSGLIKAITENEETESKFYEVSLSKMGTSMTKRGVKKTPDDIYVISEDKLNVYYIRGVKIGDERYYTLNEKLTGLAEVEPEIDEGEIEATNAKLKVVKKQKTWTNRVDIEIKTLIKGTENVFMILEGTSYKANITALVKTNKGIAISKDTIPSAYKETLKNATSVKIEKRQTSSATSTLIDVQTISLANLDVEAPVIDKNTFILTIKDGKKSITSNGTDSKSGLSDYKYQIVSKMIDGEVIKNVESSVSDVVDATGSARREITEHLKGFAKVSPAKRLELPADTYHVRVILSDKAGNYSEYKDYILVSMKKINAPKLVTGMIPVKWSSTQEKFVEIAENDSGWYNYTASNKQWANAITKNSSGQITGYYVWIPRFAYKIMPGTSTEENANGAGHFEIKFLIEKSKNYFDETIKATKPVPLDYTVHPAFQDGSATGFKNGEWDEEIEGFWFAKYEAGFASKGNSVKVARSNNLNSATGDVLSTRGEIKKVGSPDTYNDGFFDLDKILERVRGPIKNLNNHRNAIDGRQNPDWKGVTPHLSYPVFLANTASYNYLNLSDMFILSQSLNDTGNPYGFSKVDSDTHLIKNSEWGAVTYLAYSDYGVKNKRIALNQASALSKDTGTYKFVYGITASSETENASYSTLTADKLAYSNRNQSTTGNVYGVYDMQGGVWEKTSSFINNGTEYLKGCMKAAVSDAYGNTLTKSTKYTTLYPHSSTDKGRSEELNSLGGLLDYVDAMTGSSEANWKENTSIYGDAMRETAHGAGMGTIFDGDAKAAWFAHQAAYPAECYANIKRGGQGYNV